jgi:hypothetical protein
MSWTGTEETIFSINAGFLMSHAVRARVRQVRDKTLGMK